VEAFVFRLLLLLVLRKQLLCAFLSLIFLCGMMSFVVDVLPTMEMCQILAFVSNWRQNCSITLFIDFKKVYDSVGKGVLYNKVEEPMKLVRLIKMCSLKSIVKFVEVHTRLIIFRP
jgi:hypothetical protein